MTSRRRAADAAQSDDLHGSIVKKRPYFASEAGSEYPLLPVIAGLHGRIGDFGRKSWGEGRLWVVVCRKLANEPFTSWKNGEYPLDVPATGSIGCGGTGCSGNVSRHGGGRWHRSLRRWCTSALGGAGAAAFGGGAPQPSGAGACRSPRGRGRAAVGCRGGPPCSPAAPDRRYARRDRSCCRVRRRGSQLLPRPTPRIVRRRGSSVSLTATLIGATAAAPGCRARHGCCGSGGSPLGRFCGTAAAGWGLAIPGAVKWPIIRAVHL